MRQTAAAPDLAADGIEIVNQGAGGELRCIEPFDGRAQGCFRLKLPRHVLGDTERPQGLAGTVADEAAMRLPESTITAGFNSAEMQIIGLLATFHRSGKFRFDALSIQRQYEEGAVGGINVEFARRAADHRFGVAPPFDLASGEIHLPYENIGGFGGQPQTLFAFAQALFCLQGTAGLDVIAILQTHCPDASHPCFLRPGAWHTPLALDPRKNLRICMVTLSNAQLAIRFRASSNILRTGGLEQKRPRGDDPRGQTAAWSGRDSGRLGFRVDHGARQFGERLIRRYFLLERCVQKLGRTLKVHFLGPAL